jgi:hypothetical protein
MNEKSEIRNLQLLSFELTRKSEIRDPLPFPKGEQTDFKRAKSLEMRIWQVPISRKFKKNNYKINFLEIQIQMF